MLLLRSKGYLVACLPIIPDHSDCRHPMLAWRSCRYRVRGALVVLLSSFRTQYREDTLPQKRVVSGGVNAPERRRV
jgi:hypothetical protein